MKPWTRIFTAVTICGSALIFAVAWRLFFPIYQQQEDEPMKSASREQVRQIMAGINRFVELNPEHRFPSNLIEVTPLIAFDTTNIQAVCNKFVYLPPPTYASQKELFGRIVLIEKLGHYKHREGGYVGMAGDEITGWCTVPDYSRLAEKEGISIEHLSELQK